MKKNKSASLLIRTQQPKNQLVTIQLKKQMCIIVEVISFLSNLFSIAATLLAFYIYFTQKEKILKAFDILLNYSLQSTLIEFRLTLARLNELNADNTNHLDEILNIIGEIEGHILGNEILNRELPKILAKILLFRKTPAKLTEAAKRAFVSELRGKINTIDISSKTNS